MIPLLSDAILSADPQNFVNLGFLIVALAALAGAGNQVMGLVLKVRNMKGPLPGEVTADRVKALEDKVSGIENRIEIKLVSIDEKMDELVASFTNTVKELNYTIGRIDGRNEQL